MRTKRELERDSDSVKRKYNHERTIDQLMKDQSLNEYERLTAVKRKADQMENQAKMRERLMKVEQAGGVAQQDNVQKTIEVNDMYMEAITAKLKILDNI